MPTAEAARAIQEWRDLVSGPRGTLAESRQHAEDFFAKYLAPPELKVEHAEVGGIPGDWLSMPGADANRVVLYIHGGAFVLGSARGYRAMCARLAKATKARIFVVDYRLGARIALPCRNSRCGGGVPRIAGTGCSSILDRDCRGFCRRKFDRGHTAITTRCGRAFAGGRRLHFAVGRSRMRRRHHEVEGGRRSALRT